MFDVLTTFESSDVVVDARRHRQKENVIQKDHQRHEKELENEGAKTSSYGGMEMPSIGFGTAGLGSETKESVLHALEVGYRMVDTAQAPVSYTHLTLPTKA